MSNIFSGGSHDLDLSNGATAVFIDVLMLAVSDLASEDWDFLLRGNPTHRRSSVKPSRRGGQNWPLMATRPHNRQPVRTRCSPRPPEAPPP
ncbi:hypothetical protein ACQEVY_06000 [Streptomyces sp. CA-288835]